MHKSSPLEEIQALRGEADLDIDRSNSSRYCLVVRESDGTRTAYCFSVPIYEQATGRLISRRFRHKDDLSYLEGSTAHITVGEKIRMETGEGTCRIEFPEKVLARTTMEINGATTKLYPTTNGLAFLAACEPGRSRRVKFSVSRPFLTTRSNDRCFALMQEEHQPFLVASCIGVADAGGRLLSPAQLEYQKLTDSEYALEISHRDPRGRAILHEINLYEPRLFQDTTAESAQPRTNNVFGSVAFLGDTGEYGRQWLYSRPDLAKIPEMMDRHIHRVRLYLPRYDAGTVALTAHQVAQRFCSFGSRWDNKVEAAGEAGRSTAEGAYHSLDLTKMMTDANHYLTQREGLILRTEGSNTIVATGDSCYAAQILEINFR